MIVKILNYFADMIIIWRYKVTEPEYVLPIDQHTAIKRLIKSNKTDYWYKIYPVKGYLLYSKVLISKLEVNNDNIRYKYLYSVWMPDKNFINTTLLKYSEEDYEFLLDSLKENIFKQENAEVLKQYSFEKHNFTLTYKNLETILIKNNNKYIQEYALDQIFKNKPEQLIELIDIIFTNKYSSYIKRYFKELLKLKFEFTDYKTLINYHSILETTYNQDLELKQVKEHLLKIIQFKNDIEIQKMNLKLN